MSGRDHPTWEYRIAADLSETDLNRLGAAGWELVAVASDDASATCYLKRRRLDFREQVTLEQKSAYYARRAEAAGESGTAAR
jgi:hypothetical protein